MQPGLEFYFGVVSPVADQTASTAVAIKYYQTLSGTFRY